MTALQFLAAFVGTVAFALLFGVPRRFYPYCDCLRHIVISYLLKLVF